MRTALNFSPLKTLVLICISFCVTFFYSCSDKKNETENSKTEIKIQEGLSAQQYFNLAVSYYYQARYDECEQACERSLQVKPDDAQVYDLLCGLYTTQNKWKEAIAVGEKALAINPQSLQTYAPLYYSYAGIEDWEKAKKACIQSLQQDPNNTIAKDNLATTKTHLESIRISKFLLTIIIILSILSFIFFIIKNKQTDLNNKHNSFAIFLIASTASYLIYLTFYHFSEYVWSMNLKMPAEKITPVIRAYIYEHDGIEGYVLYSLMILNIIITCLLVRFSAFIKTKTTSVFVFAALMFFTFIYFLDINFLPPIPLILKNGGLLLIFSVIIITTLFLLIDNYLNKLIVTGIAILLLIPVCFISTDVISIFDYSLIFAPAHRMLGGAPVSDIYLQYDLLLSLLAAGWMKLNFDLNHFQLIGQFSFFLFLTGSLIFAKRFFNNKKLPVLFFISLVLIRYYSAMDEPVSLLQITPIRLDLWFIILLLVYYKGVYNWITGILVGLLVLIHKNFGLLYLLSYCELIFTLFLVEFIQLLIDKKISVAALRDILLKHIRFNFINILIISGFLGMSILLFKGFVAQSAILYQQMGIGMLPISPHSFYWYVPVVLSIAFVLLLKYKNSLPDRYFSSGLFIIFVAISNSMYFFGRSHESNIINISGILLFALFLLFDLLNRNNKVLTEVISDKKNIDKNNAEANNGIKFKKTVVLALPVVLILGASYFYSSRISGKVKTQYQNLKRSQYIYPLKNVPADFAALKKLTHNSKKLYFLNFRNDFLYYYYGDYQEVGYYNPFGAWVLKDELVTFINKLLEDDYYIVSTNPVEVVDLGILPKINYNNVVTENGYTIINKEKIPLLLPVSANSAVHLGINHDLKINCIDLAPVTLKNNFTIELILKPKATHPNNAILIGNKNDVVGPEGFIIQQNGANQNQFLFAYGGGKAWITPIVFNLTADQWNYLVVSVNNNYLKISNNGQLIYSGTVEFPMQNSDLLLTIGNGKTHVNHFNGLIREIKITNDIISEQTVLNNTNLIKEKLQ